MFKNRVLLTVLLVLFGLAALAQYNTGVYREQGGNRLGVASGAEIDIESGAELEFAGQDFENRVIKGDLDCGASDCSAGTVDLGVDLPANAIITRTWFYVKTQFVDSGSGTVAVHCEDANNLFSAADITGYSDGTIVSGAITGSSPGTYIAGIAAACDVTATIATAEQTAGVLDFFIEYVVHD